MLLAGARLSSQGIRHRGVRMGLIESTSSIFDPDVLEDIPTKHNHHQNKSQVDPTNLHISESDTSGIAILATHLYKAESDRVDTECYSRSARFGRSQSCNDPSQPDSIGFSRENKARHVVI